MSTYAVDAKLEINVINGTVFIDVKKCIDDIDWYQTLCTIVLFFLHLSYCIKQSYQSVYVCRHTKFIFTYLYSHRVYINTTYNKTNAFIYFLMHSMLHYLAQTVYTATIATTCISHCKCSMLPGTSVSYILRVVKVSYFWSVSVVFNIVW